MTSTESGGVYLCNFYLGVLNTKSSDPVSLIVSAKGVVILVHHVTETIFKLTLTRNGVVEIESFGSGAF